MQETAKKTPLYSNHIARDAKMGNFGGYDMPLWYPSGPKNEHLAVIKNAGIFDTSHMAAISIQGKDAFDLLQYCFSKDLSACIGPKKNPIEDGKCVYGVFLNESGFVIDDSLVYCHNEAIFTIIVNAGMGATITRHLLSNQNGRDVTIVDLTDTLGKIDVQGPKAAKIMAKVIQQSDLILEKLPYFNFKGHYDLPGTNVPESSNIPLVSLLDGTPILLSRTGYTGEFGFEIFLRAEHTKKLWDLVIEAGKEFDALTCGLAARDSLRTGAVLPLSHQDIGDWPFVENPWLFALPFNEDSKSFSKDFIGAKALLSVETPTYTHAFAGFDPRKVIPDDGTIVLDDNETEIGTVLTCATDMAIDRYENKIISMASEDCPTDMKFRGLSCGFVKTKHRLSSGQVVYLQGGNRRFKVEIRDDIRPARTARKAMGKMR